MVIAVPLLFPLDGAVGFEVLLLLLLPHDVATASAARRSV
jgi:hypothetical protein